MIPKSLLSEIQQTLKSLVGRRIDIVSVAAISGGDINQAYRLLTRQGSYFLKFNYADRFPKMFQAESSGLELLRKSGTLRAPKVIGCGDSGKYSWLLLEFIEQGCPEDDFWDDFGKSLASMHRNSNEYFGLDHNNYIGSLYQSNRPRDNWFDFFIGERLQKQIRIVRDKGLADNALISQFENLYKAIPEIFPAEPPSLIHGDLWSGNFMCDLAGSACLIDPAVYYGFREMDIAMSRLFGGFSKRFYEAYQDAWPLLPGWQYRLEICNLYPLLVHVNLFGAGYLNQIKSVVSRY